jgi:tetratricopeptide (TPR) repeat protein/V8-like Glu-specific endopeptidase
MFLGVETMGYWCGWLPVAGAMVTVALVHSVAVAKTAQEVNQIAEAITVRINFPATSNRGTGNGSGILLQKNGDVYTVLTAAHVVKSKPENQLKITTNDDRQYAVIPGSMRSYNGDIDLAVVKFRANGNYKLAELGDSNKLAGGMELYVGGFPVPTTVITESTFVFREGKVTANSKRVYKDGYALLYSNDTLPGMSGGPILNESGQVVGVHGKGDREQETRAKTGFNAGIPIARFADIAMDLGVNLGTETRVARTVQSPTVTADDYFISAGQKNEQGNYQGALIDYDKSINLNPNYSFAYNNRGILKDQLNDIPGALADYNKAITLDPNNANAYSNRGLLKDEKLNDTSGALADYNKTITLDPNNAIAYSNRGNLKANKLNDIPGALADYNKAIALDPNNSISYYNRGSLKNNKLNDIPGALADYNKAIALNPNNAIAYSNRGLLKKNKLNDVPGALADYNRAITLNPNDASAYISRGILKAEKLDSTPGALADFNKAITLDPNNANAYQNRGVLKHLKLNDTPGAITDLRQAAKLHRQQGHTKGLQSALEVLRLIGATE